MCTVPGLPASMGEFRMVDAPRAGVLQRVNRRNNNRLQSDYRNHMITAVLRQHGTVSVKDRRARITAAEQESHSRRIITTPVPTRCAPGTRYTRRHALLEGTQTERGSLTPRPWPSRCVRCLPRCPVAH